MKLIWLSAVVIVGSALVVRATEEETNHLQELQQGRQVAGAVDAATDVTDALTTAVADPVSQILLSIGNVLGFIDDIDLPNIPGLAGVGGLAGGAAAGATALAAANSVKTAILSLILKPLDFVNGILAIVGLVLLIMYLISSEGDIGGLVGTGFLRRESDDFGYDSYSNYVNTARALWDAPIVQRLATAVQEAIVKYD